MSCTPLQDRILLEAVFEPQSKSELGLVVDVLDIHAKTTGPFVI